MTAVRHIRWLGDKRSMRVHDLGRLHDGCRIDDLLGTGRQATFGPDILVEAQNRGYRPCPACVGAMN